jgi:Na+/melibiose symporter-like transporter
MVLCEGAQEITYCCLLAWWLSGCELDMVLGMVLGILLGILACCLLMWRLETDVSVCERTELGKRCKGRGGLRYSMYTGYSK